MTTFSFVRCSGPCGTGVRLPWRPGRTFTCATCGAARRVGIDVHSRSCVDPIEGTVECCCGLEDQEASNADR